MNGKEGYMSPVLTEKGTSSTHRLQIDIGTNFAAYPTKLRGNEKYDYDLLARLSSIKKARNPISKLELITGIPSDVVDEMLGNRKKASMFRVDINHNGLSGTFDVAVDDKGYIVYNERDYSSRITTSVAGQVVDIFVKYIASFDIKLGDISPALKQLSKKQINALMSNIRMY